MRASYDLTIDTTSNQLQDVQADSLTGNLRRFADVLISNANRVFPGKWAVGECPATGDKTLAFGESDNCLAVLQRLCQEFDTEFEIEQSGGVNTVNLKKVGQIFPYTFRYGKGNGLYSLERQNVSSANIITRLKVYGASKNITHKYRAHRLCLPGKSKGESYIEKPEAVGMFGVWEATKFFDDEYPKQKGTVTGVFSDSVLKFTDSAMSFDLNEKEADGKTTKYLIAGSAAKVHFNSGNLSGYEFEVSEYDHASKTFTLKAYKDDRGETFPSTTSTAFQFAVGDEYKLLDIAMPQAIVDAAEASLAAAGEKYYTQNSQPKVQYALDIAEEFLKSLSGLGTVANIVMVGDYVPIQDADIGVNKSVRVQAFSRDLLHPYRYSLTLSDTVTTSITNRVISELIDVEKIISINNLKDPRRSRASWRSSREILSMIFDPEGHYYADKIKPLSIDTIALTVGAKSMQFGLTNTAFHPNYGGNKNVIKVKGGVLTHYTIGPSARSWTLADNTTTFESDSQAYYIYAKCQRTGSAGSVIFSKEQIKAEQDPAYYHFWIGVVNSVDPDIKARTLALMYGFTFISGRYISTGRIQSADGATYFDLDEGVISGNISIMAGSTGYNNLTDKPNLTVYKTKAEFNVFANQISGQVSQINTRLGGTESELNSLNTWTRQKISQVETGLSGANDNIYALQTAGFITTAQGNALYASAQDMNGNKLVSLITQTPTAINLLSRNIVLTGNTTFNSFKTETQNSLAKKPNKSELGNLAYKSMVSKAQLDNTIIDGGFIKTSLIDVNNLVVNNVLKVGSFTVQGGWLTCNSNEDGGGDGYINMKSANTRIAFGRNLIPSTSGGGFTCVAMIENNNIAGLGGTTCGMSIRALGDYSRGIRSVAMRLDGGLSVTGGCSIAEAVASDVFTTSNSATLFKYYNTFVFQPSSGVYANLPSRAAISSAFGWMSDGRGADYASMIRIKMLVTRWADGYVRVQAGDSGTPLIDNNGGTMSYIDMRRGDFLELGYYNSAWYILNHID